LPSEGNALSS